MSVPTGARVVSTPWHTVRGPGASAAWQARVGVAHGPSVSASGRGEVSTQCARAVRALAPPSLRECARCVRHPPGAAHASWAGLLPPPWPRRPPPGATCSRPLPTLPAGVYSAVMTVKSRPGWPAWAPPAARGKPVCDASCHPPPPGREPGPCGVPTPADWVLLVGWSCWAHRPELVLVREVS